jgi:TPR repeat protein
MMKTSWGKPVHVIAFIRTLLIVLAVAACTVAAEDLQTVRKKAEAGDADAQLNLGWMYEKGKGVPEDDAEAVKWYRKAAEQGNAKAQYNLAVMYYDGRGVPQDYAEAVKWCRMAAEQGYAYAQVALDELKPSIFLNSLTPIENVFVEESGAHSEMKRDIDSLRNVVTQLQAIDTSKCPKDFRLAWLEQKSILGSYVPIHEGGGFENYDRKVD